MSADPGLEGLTVARWLWGTLTGDAGLQGLAGGPQALQERVSEGQYDGDAPWWIVFTILDPRDIKVVGMTQVMSEVQFQVKVVGAATGYAPLIEPYRRVHAVLEGRTNQQVNQGGLILTSQRVSGIQYPERTNGIEYRHLGGLYETLTQ